MKDIVQLSLFHFGLIYLLLIVVLILMKKSKIDQTKLMLLASVRMTLQLIIAGYLLTYIFENPHPFFTVAYLMAMVVFAILRVLKKSSDINRNFKIAIAFSIAMSGIGIVLFFVIIVVGKNLFEPQYTIPISGMIIGNSMTGITLGLKTFTQNLKTQQEKIETLLNMGVTPKKILLPFVNNALETALLPTMNSMLGMGIVSLPGMMTGQILSGTLPTTAILYQIAIMIAICSSVCLTVYASLNLGYKTLYNKRNQILF